jgi:hypothetical protein
VAHNCGTIASRQTAKRSAQKPFVHRTSFNPTADNFACGLLAVFTKPFCAEACIQMILPIIKASLFIDFILCSQLLYYY